MDMMKKTVFAFAAAAFIGIASGNQALAGDAAAGEKVFQKCKACHMVTKERHKSGPHLVNLFGRAPVLPKVSKKYSKAMKEVVSSGTQKPSMPILKHRKNTSRARGWPLPV